MDAKEKDGDYGMYFLLAAICGIATAWVVTGSLLWIFIGALLGLLTAGLFVNGIVKGSKKD